MSNNINDLYKSYLTGLGYTAKSVPDLLKQALQDINGTSTRSVSGLWREFLAAQGYTGSFPDAMYAYLGSLGHTGSIHDRLAQSLLAGDLLGSGAVTTESYPFDGDTTAVGFNTMSVTGTTVSYTSNTTNSTYVAAPQTVVDNFVNVLGGVSGQVGDILIPSSGKLYLHSFVVPSSNIIASPTGTGSRSINMTVAGAKYTSGVSDTYIEITAGMTYDTTDPDGKMVFEVTGDYSYVTDTYGAGGLTYPSYHDKPILIYMDCDTRKFHWNIDGVSSGTFEQSSGVDYVLPADITHLYLLSSANTSGISSGGSYDGTSIGLTYTTVGDNLGEGYKWWAVVNSLAFGGGTAEDIYGNTPSTNVTMVSLTDNTTPVYGTPDSTYSGAIVARKIQENAPTTNYSASDPLSVFKWDAGDTGNVLIKYDLSSITEPGVVGKAIISGSTVTPTSGSTPQYTVSAYNVLRDWDPSTVTWNQYSSGNNWGTAGAWSSSDIDLVRVGEGYWSSTGLGNLKNVQGIDVTGIVNDWLTGAATNYGLLLERSNINEHATASGYVGSSRSIGNTGAADGSRPELVMWIVN